MLVEYIKPIISDDKDIQRTVKVIGRIENRAISMLINDIGIYDILEKYLSTKERNSYYFSKYRLRTLFNKKQIEGSD